MLQHGRHPHSNLIHRRLLDRAFDAGPSAKPGRGRAQLTAQPATSHRQRPLGALLTPARRAQDVRQNHHVLSTGQAARVPQTHASQHGSACQALAAYSLGSALLAWLRTARPSRVRRHQSPQHQRHGIGGLPRGAHPRHCLHLGRRLGGRVRMRARRNAAPVARLLAPVRARAPRLVQPHRVRAARSRPCRVAALPSCLT